MTFTPRSAIERHIQSGPWLELERLAVEACDEATVKAASTQPFRPVLGGGTRLMLAIEHRISDDIDLFMSDLQWLGYLTPRLSAALEDRVSNYHESATALKLQFDGLGEIDFIGGGSLLGLPPKNDPQRPFPLEAPTEVLAKKLFHRGWALTSRDLFDWRMLERTLPPQELDMGAVSALMPAARWDGVEQALQAMTRTAGPRTTWDAIRTPYPLKFDESVEWALARVAELRPNEPVNRVTTAPAQGAGDIEPS